MEYFLPVFYVRMSNIVASVEVVYIVEMMKHKAVLKFVEAMLKSESLLFGLVVG